MTPSIPRCDRDPGRLRRLLDDDGLAEAEEAELVGHLDACEACRRALETLAAESLWWDAARRLARPERPEVAPGPGSPAAPADGPALDFLMPSDDPAHLGRLGGYEVLQVLGHGGMGVVLKGYEPAINRQVAIKVLAPQLATSAAARRRFAREARAAGAVAHEHVVAIYAVDATPGGLPYLVMPYISGKSLQDRLDRDGPLELRALLRIGMQVASGLAAAHAQGLIHRDIKPSNILLENCVERVKISDFGLARAVDDASLTQSGVLAGTPQYMAPEQARGESVDPRADLFSLGSVLYAMATGRSPFRAETTMAVLRRVCEDTPRPIREVNPEVPEWLAAIIARLHAKDPADRFQSAAEVAELLGRCLAHLEGPDRMPPPFAPAPQRFARPRAVAGVALLLVLAGLGAAGATGVPQQVADLVATVLRIPTSRGTLVVRVDDPKVKIKVDGEELVVTDAGPQEIRLRPGQYRLEASKDGVVRSRTITIERGGKTSVSVDLEPDLPQDGAEPAIEANIELQGRQLKKAIAAAGRQASQSDAEEIERLKDQIKQLQTELDRVRRHSGPRFAIAGGRPPISIGRVLPGPPPPLDLDLVSRRFQESPTVAALLEQKANAEKQLEKAKRLVREGRHKSDPTVRAAEDVVANLNAKIADQLKKLATQIQRILPTETPGDGEYRPPREAGFRWSAALSASMPAPSAVFGAAVSPDGKTLALACGDATIRLWDLPTRQSRAVLEGHTTRVWSVAFAPDGRTLASAAGDRDQPDRPGEVRLWDVATGQSRADLRGHTSVASCVAFSPDGRTVASGGWDHTARLWDAETGEARATLTGHDDAVRTVAFSPDGTRLATGGFDGDVKFWDPAGTRFLAGFLAHEDGVGRLAFAPDGRTLATAPRPSHDPERPAEVKLWDVASGCEKSALRGHRGDVEILAFAPDGQTLATAGGSYAPSSFGEVRFWDVANGRERATLDGLACPVEALAFTPDGKTLISVGVRGKSGQVRLWDLPRTPRMQPRATLRMPWQARRIWSVAFAPDGKTLAVGAGVPTPGASGFGEDDGILALWDVDAGTWRQSSKEAGAVRSVAFAPDGRFLATAELRQPAKLRTPADGVVRRAIPGPEAGANAVVFSRRGPITFLVIPGLDASVRVWYPLSGRPGPELRGHTAGVVTAAVSPDGRTIASGGLDATARLWDAFTGQERCLLLGHTQAVEFVAFAPDGRTLATADRDGVIKLWDVDDGRELAILLGHRAPVLGLAFAPDGQTLASCGGTWGEPDPGPGIGELKLWEVAGGIELASLPSHTDRVFAVAFSPDGKTLASAGWDGTVLLWDVDEVRADGTGDATTEAGPPSAPDPTPPVDATPAATPMPRVPPPDAARPTEPIPPPTPNSPDRRAISDAGDDSTSRKLCRSCRGRKNAT